MDVVHKQRFGPADQMQKIVHSFPPVDVMANVCTQKPSPGHVSHRDDGQIEGLHRPAQSELTGAPTESTSLIEESLQRRTNKLDLAKSHRWEER